MKRIIFTFCIAFLSVGLTAQNFVSTTAENKNVVLEEFTGIYCTWCPAGHLIANNMASSNAGDVFLINVHAGGYAAPSGSDPDFRTSFGAAIDGQSGLAGYPAGTVNRRNFPGLEQGNAGATAMSRGDWATAGSTIMGETSPVNIAAVATADPITRMLTVVVETYYTSNAAASTHKLNVALTQDDVEGPQTGSTNNTAQVLPNGNYNHNHMLRHLLTGQWGVDVATTTMGYFQADTFMYQLPNDINGIGLDITKLDVVVFLAEGQQNIITGNATAVNVTIPAGYTAGDLGLTSVSTAPTGYCTANFTPMVNVTNPGSVDINNYTISYAVNGGTPVTQAVSTPITAGANTNLSFPQITLTGTSSIEYSVEFASTNPNMLELSTGNNNDSDGPFPLLDASFNFGDNFMEGFQTLSNGDPAPPNSIAVNPDDIRAFAVNKSIANLSYDLGGHGNSDGCFRWDFVDIATGSSMIVFEEIDLSNVAGASLDFTYGYAQWANENDRLEVLISIDCGSSWITLWDKAGADLATAPALSGARFYPDPNQWQDVNIDLSVYKTLNNLNIAFRGTSAYGNSLYLDDVNVASSTVSTNDVSVVNDLKVFPNPATTNVNLQFSLENNEDMNINVMNALGQVVEVVSAGNLASGEHNLSVNTEDFTAGIYFVNFSNGATSTTKRFVVSK